MIFWGDFQAGLFHDSMNDALVLVYTQNRISTLQYQAVAVFVVFVHVTFWFQILFFCDQVELT